ncbi:hypothetical protein Tco_0927112 [Tanacetum coccineum]|uniref:Uncharacterized protein n=1 Tax=Tanacetum coccineum TaxID=301880 RepID=A0ABQ5DDN6_9ASTR
MGRDTIQLEDAVSTSRKSNSKKCTSEYGVFQEIASGLPAQRKAYMDFQRQSWHLLKTPSSCEYPETIQATGKEHPTMLHQAPRLLEKLEQSVLLGGRKHIPHRYGMAYWCPKGWDATSRFLFRIGRNDVKHTSNPFPKTTRALIMPSRAESELLSRGRRGPRTEDPTGRSSKHKSPPIQRKSHDQRAVAPMTRPEVGRQPSRVPYQQEEAPQKGNDEAETKCAAQAIFPGLLSISEPHRYPSKTFAQSFEIPTENVATTEVQDLHSAESLESRKSTSYPSMVGSPEGIYQPGWGVTNSCCLDTSGSCQDVVDHIVPLGYFFELRHMPNADFLIQYNRNSMRQVAMGSQLRLRFEQEVRLLKKAKAQIAIRDQRIQVREEEIKRLGQEIQSLRIVKEEVHGLRKKAYALSTQTSQLITISFSNRLNIGARNGCSVLDALRIDFDDSCTSYMLTAITVAGWVIGMVTPSCHKVLLESTELRSDLAAVEAYDPEADAKYSRGPLHVSKRNLKFTLVLITGEAEGCLHRRDYCILTLAQ